MLTDLPLRSTIHKPDLSGRMARWAIELSEFGILLDNLNWWTLNVDEASRKIRAGIGLQLKSPTGEKIKQAIRLGFSASNNESEYEAILAGVELAVIVSTDKLLIRRDSQLVVRQVNEEYESRDPRMEKYVSLVKQRLGSFSA